MSSWSRPVDRLSSNDGAAELGELPGERLDQTLAVGLLVVNSRDLRDAGLEQVLRGERTLDGVRRTGAEVRVIGPLRRRLEVGTLGQRRVGVGGRDLDDLRGGEHGLGALADA